MKFFNGQINPRNIVFALLMIGFFITLARAMRHWYMPEGMTTTELENDACQLYCNDPMYEVVKWLAQTTSNTPGFTAPDSTDPIKVHWTPKLVEIANNVLRFCAEQLCTVGDTMETCLGNSNTQADEDNFRLATFVRGMTMKGCSSQ